MPFSSQANPYNNVCDQCYRRKISCSREKPACERCQQSDQQCTYSVTRPSGRPRRSISGESRQHRRSIVRNSIRKHEEALQRRGLYTPVSQASLEGVFSLADTYYSVSLLAKIIEILKPMYSLSRRKVQDAKTRKPRCTIIPSIPKLL
jgi:hypothetical protein